MTIKLTKQIECRGSPYEIGYTHGSQAAVEISRCIAFYASLFIKTSKQEWSQVQQTASSFSTLIAEKWPRYHEEIRGIADGAKRDILDIVAINVRTEIVFGLFTDGCTSLFWRTPKNVFLGQNWDWMEEQKQNLVILTVHQPSLPTIKMITEAGIIGKIGMNSAGVGVCFNAIRAKGLTSTRMPVHLGLRTVLESTSAAEAIGKLEEVGMASAAHMLIADGNEGGHSTGLEFTNSTFAKLGVTELGTVVHSNHLLLKHDSVEEPPWLEDSPRRVAQMTALTKRVKGSPGWKEFSELFEDEKDFPTAICRKQEGKSKTGTLFNIVMDLKARQAVIRMGRPVDVEEVVELAFY